MIVARGASDRCWKESRAYTEGADLLSAAPWAVLRPIHGPAHAAVGRIVMLSGTECVVAGARGLTDGALVEVRVSSTAAWRWIHITRGIVRWSSETMTGIEFLLVPAAELRRVCDLIDQLCADGRIPAGAGHSH